MIDFGKLLMIQGYVPSISQVVIVSRRFETL
jgi:hypothetical protein